MTEQQSMLELHKVSDCVRYTVVVPVYNGAGVIDRCLDALAVQTVGAESYEVIVVDDGSTDGTAEVVQAWNERNAQQKHCCVQLVRQENAGPAAARNHGAQMARAALVLFTDADCAPAFTWIEKLAAPFVEAEVVGAKGVYFSEQTGLTPRFVQAEYEDRYDRMRHQAQIDFIDTYSAAYRRDIFLENGGFDTIFTTASVEDQEFSFRLAQKGYRLVFVADAAVGHIHDQSIAEYARRKYYIGFWKALLTRWHPERMVQDSHTPQVLKLQIVLCALFLGQLPLWAAGLLFSPLSWFGLTTGLVALLFMATTLPFMHKLARRSWRLAFYAPVMLGVRALALGSGYLVGTIHFAGTVAGARQPVIPGWKRLIKRGIDITGALVGLLISIPLVAIAAIAIKLDSPGPVFFRQLRIGENGRPFHIIKLRSMVDNAEEQLEELVDLDQLSEPVFKLDNDPRVTRIGRLLRRTSLDETPQFFNVLVGDMSLVGPRPEEVRIVERYEDQHRRRLAVKPGMTGPMQINGRGSLLLSERLRLELDYIDNFSLRQDFVILLRTLPTIWHGSGAF